MESSVRWIVLTGLLLICLSKPSHSQPDDPCDPAVYELIDMHEGRREKDYEPQETDQLLCDSKVDEAKWMRFVRDDLSYQLTNEDCVETNHCGTQGPVWMASDSSHPTAVGVDGEKVVNICTNLGVVGCCSVIGTSTVRLCDDNFERYYVYKLPRPPECYTGYCVDRVTGSCEPNYKRASKLDPNSNCISVYPPQTPPKFDGPDINGTSINFYCQVAYAGTADLSAGARFDVTFLFDAIADPNIPAIPVTAGSSALLDDIHLQDHLGKEISCSSKSYWESDEDSKGPDLKSSKGYFIGVRVDNNRLTLSEVDGAPKEVVLRSTLPVLCNDPANSCRACTRVVTDGNMVTGDGEKCEYCFKPDDWKPTEKAAYGQTSTLQVSPLKSPRVDPTSTYFIQFSPFEYGDDVNGGGMPETSLTGYQMKNILVIHTDTNYGLCQATGDPHITTFDGKYYHVYDIGQFLMWKSSAARHFEVHARFWNCLPTVSCVCAVAVREGNAILGVDRCGSRTLTALGRPKIKQYSPSAWGLPSGAFVSTNRANGYYINMPSGAYVRADVNYWGLNIYLNALAEDQTKSSGLCGNFDGQRQNDLKIKGTERDDPANDQQDQLHVFPIQFSNSYRIPRSHSFFDSEPQKLTLPDRGLTKCRCNAGAIDCSPQADVEGTRSDTEDEVDTMQNKDKNTGNERRRRRKREVDELSDRVDDDVEKEFNYGEDFIPVTNFKWPTDSGITESNARDICETAFNALPYKDECIAETNIDIQDSVEQCIEDIKIMDNTTWAHASLGTFETRCQFFLLQNPDMYSEGSDGKLEPSMQILGKMCPSDCNEHGSCVDGVCNCTDGFIGVDCSLKEGAAPVLHYIPGTGQCDLTLRPCKEFRLEASQFQKTDKLTCRVTELSSKASSGDSPVSHDPTVISTSHGTAKFITAAEIACKLPEIASQDMAYYQLRFDFSYDGEKYSNQLDLTVFDGECLECENDCGNPANWIMLDNSCLIDGRCVMAGDTHTENSCFICDPSQSINQWTPLSTDQCSGVTLPPEPTPAPGITTTQSPTSDEGPPFPIIAGVVGGVLLIVAVAAAVACYIKRKNGKPATDHTYEGTMQPSVIYDKTGKVDIYDQLGPDGVYEDPPEIPRPENDYQPHRGPLPEYADTAAPVKY